MTVIECLICEGHVVLRWPDLIERCDGPESGHRRWTEKDALWDQRAVRPLGPVTVVRFKP